MKRRLLLAGAVLSLVSRPGAAGPRGGVDVLVIGAGIAGLAAAVSAREAGAGRVLVLEKGPMIGGHAAYADGSICAVYPKLQKKAGIEDSPALMARQLWEWGGRQGDLRLIETLARGSGSAIDWLQSMGVRFMPRVYVSYPGSYPRAITSHPDRGGFEYIWALNRRARALGVEVLLNARASALTSSGGRVTGVQVERSGRTETVAARSVVIATGGFSANKAMVRRFAPQGFDPDAGSSANPGGRHFDGADGDGIRMAQEAGAALSGMSEVELITRHGGRLLDYAGGDIYVNAEGRRFVNENVPHREQARAILAQPGQVIWVITDSKSLKGPVLQHKLAIGEVRQAASVEEMARAMKVPRRSLEETLSRYNGFVERGRDLDFGKTVFTQKIDTPPFYFGRETLEAHYTIGGIRINPQAAVLRANGTAIPGLWAAGETTGGVHGTSRQGGAAFTDCLVFGRIAGREAARAARRTP